MEAIDLAMLLAWTGMLVSTVTTTVILALGLKHNHLMKGFRPLLSTLAAVSVVETGNAAQKFVARVQHIADPSMPILNSWSTVAITSLEAIAWCSFAYILLTLGKPLKESVTKKSL